MLYILQICLIRWVCLFKLLQLMHQLIIKKYRYPWVCSLRTRGFRSYHKCGVTLLSGYFKKISQLKKYLYCFLIKKYDFFYNPHIKRCPTVNSPHKVHIYGFSKIIKKKIISKKCIRLTQRKTNYGAGNNMFLHLKN